MRSFFLTRYRQHKKQLSNVLMAAAAAAGCFAGSAQASSISIVNASFADTQPALGYGAFTGGADGWTSVGSSGGHTNPSVIYDGDGGSSYANGGAGITQTLGTNLAAGTYTLNAFVQLRNEPDTYAAELFGGATSVGSNSLSSVGGGDTSWHLLSLVVPILTGNSNIGSPITITYGFTGGQGYLDAVSLDFVAAAVPEPNSFVLTSIGAAALGLVSRRRRT